MAFIEDLLRALGFPCMFINWVMECVSTVSYQENVNGELTDLIPGKKGLRQGGPYVPALVCYLYGVFE